MRTTWPGRAEVVDVAHLSDDGEDDVVRNLRRRRTSRPGDEAEHRGEEKDPSGCRPAASHRGRALRFALEGEESNKRFGFRQPQ